MVDGGLRKLFRQKIRPAHWVSIESGDTGSGIPDAHVTLCHTSQWIEYKQTKGWAVTLRPFQIAFHLNEAHHGGRSFIAVRRQTEAGPRRGEAVDELWLLRGSCADRAREGGLRGLSQGDLLGTWHGGPRNWDWEAVRRALVEA